MKCRGQSCETWATEPGETPIQFKKALKIMQVFADIFFRRKPRRNFISPYTMKLPKILFSSFCPPIPPPFVFHWPHLVLLSPYYPFSSFFSFLKWRKRLLLTSVSSLCQRSGSWLSQPRILSLEIRAWQGIGTVYIEILMFLDHLKWDRICEFQWFGHHCQIQNQYTLKKKFKAR